MPGAAALAALGLHWLLVQVLLILPEPFPPEVLGWTAAVVAAAALAVPSILSRRPDAAGARRLLPVAALLLVLLLAGQQVNAYFRLDRSAGDLVGSAVNGVPELEQQYRASASPSAAPPASGQDAAPRDLRSWRPPAGMPATGLVRRAAIPGTRSGFHAREAYVYLPPAYLVRDRPLLPLLVLVPGQPGSPQDWITGGRLQSVMDDYAAKHHGVSPVVVVADANGDPTANRLCMDSRLGKAETYLASDVPAWARTTLDIDPDASRWAVGGFSFGGTCALQLGTRHPDLFPTIFAFSAQREPSLSADRNKTIHDSFGGNVKAFEAHTPLKLLATRRFPHSRIYFSAGSKDSEYLDNLHVLAAAARRAGATVRTAQVPHAGHSWAVAAGSLTPALDFAAAPMGLP